MFSSRFFLLVILLILSFAFCVHATPYIPPEILEAQLKERLRTQPTGPNRFLQDLDELDEYDYFVEYEQILDWLTGMQVDDPGIDFGGMREGEQQLNIIQTDNTQEALRDWCRYGLLTGDTTVYRENIDAAWVYTLEWPAWEEEGGGNPNYYRVHNCGWGLVATMEYMNAYGDTTYLWYGDECADYLDTYRLNVEGGFTNPLSAGFGAGALYLYGVWRDNEDWIEASQEIALDVKDWIDDDPERLNSYETWAMCGGTAMWGVVTALYLDDPEAGEEWIPTVSDEMDTYAGAGNWNNSWTIWYGHAWNAIHRVLGDNESLQNVIECADNLLDQDEIDDDGGVPATEDQYQNDQSWTSAYLCWYALELLFDVDPDVRPFGLRYLTESDSLFTGQTTGFIATVKNNSLDTLLDVSVTLSIDEFEISADFDIFPFDTVDVEFGREWIPGRAGEHEAVLITAHEDDLVPENDTLVVPLYVNHAVYISGNVLNFRNEEPIPSRIIIIAGMEEDNREIVSTLYNDRNTGYYYQRLPRGNYSLECSPLDIPFAFTVISDITADSLDSPYIEVNPTIANFLFVSEQPDRQYDHGCLLAFNNLNQRDESYSVCTVNLTDQDLPADSLANFDVIIWSTGDLDDDIFDADIRNPVYGFLENGGSMFFGGQGLMDKWGGFHFLRSRFGADAGELGLDSQVLTGNQEIPVIPPGWEMDLTGYPGWDLPAQETPDEVIPWGEGVTIANYTNELESSAIVAFEHPDFGYRTITAGFDIAGIPPEDLRGETISSSTFIENVLLWLQFRDDELDVNSGNISYMPLEYSFSAWPNPFNPVISLGFTIPKQEYISLKIYNVVGREVVDLSPGFTQPGTHNILWNPDNLSSGSYFVNINTPEWNSIQRIILLR